MEFAEKLIANLIQQIQKNFFKIYLNQVATKL